MASLGPFSHTLAPPPPAPFHTLTHTRTVDFNHRRLSLRGSILETSKRRASKHIMHCHVVLWVLELAAGVVGTYALYGGHSCTQPIPWAATLLKVGIR